MFNYFLTVKIMMICTNCGLETLYLKQHMSIHSDQRLFQCDKCDKTLTGYKNFMNHKKCHMTWTCIIKEEGYEEVDEDNGIKDFKPTGQKRVLTIAKADGVPEIRANVEILLDSLNLPELTEDFQLVCDLKLANIILGIQSCSSLYSCPYCEGSK